MTTAHLIQITGLAALAVLLVVAAVSDIRHRRIANSLCIVVALLALPYWLAVDPHPIDRLAIQIAIAGGVGSLLLGAFALDAIGGGDVKLMAALLLWLPLPQALNALFIASIGGAILAILLIALRRRSGTLREPTVPYGVAIAAAGLVQIAPQLIALAH